MKTISVTNLYIKRKVFIRGVEKDELKRGLKQRVDCVFGRAQ